MAEQTEAQCLLTIGRYISPHGRCPTINRPARVADFRKWIQEILLLILFFDMAICTNVSIVNKIFMSC